MSRKEQVFQKYKYAWNKPPDLEVRDLETLIAEFVAADPSGSNKYLDWMVKVGTQDMTLTSYSIIEAVRSFHQHQNALTVEYVEKFWEDSGPHIYNDNYDYDLPESKPRDINSYPELWVLEGVLNIYLASKAEKDRKNKLKEQYDTILDDENYLIVVPLTHFASKTLGFGTKWCTAMKDQSTHFNNYTANGILYYVIDKLRTNQNHPLHKFAYHREFTTTYGTTFNAPDKSMGDIQNFLPPEIIKLIDHYHKNQINIETFFELMIHELEHHFKEKPTITLKPEKDGDTKFKLNLSFVSIKQNVITFAIKDFTSWRFKIKLQIDNEGISCFPTFYRGTSNYKTLSVEDTSFDRTKLIAMSRSLKKDSKVGAGRPTDLFFNHLNEQNALINYDNVYTHIIFHLIKELCVDMCDAKWNVEFKNTLDQVVSEKNMLFTLTHNDKRKFYSKEEFEFSVGFESVANKIEFTYTSEEVDGDNYNWPSLETTCQMTLSEENIKTQLKIFIDNLKENVAKGAVKKRKPTKAEIMEELRQQEEWRRRAGADRLYRKGDHIWQRAYEYIDELGRRIHDINSECYYDGNSYNGYEYCTQDSAASMLSPEQLEIIKYKLWKIQEKIKDGR
jgi:hypothetical protein